MKVTILDKRLEAEKVCCLCKINIGEYISNLPKNYQDFDLQRDIVSNLYLDNIIDTILNKGHIPTIVLVSSIHFKDELMQKVEIDINPNDYKILDGLQRTHRLKMIWSTIQFLSEELSKSREILEVKPHKISRLYKDQLKKINSNSQLLRKLISALKDGLVKDSTELIQLYNDNFIWFEIWFNLTPDEQVKKMLILNAGHKPVSLNHQLELLFINDLWPKLKDNTNTYEAKFYRTKQISPTNFVKKRKQGELHFSQIIAALIAFKQAKTIVLNTKLVQKLQQEGDYLDNSLGYYVDYGLVEELINFLIKVDSLIIQQYNNTEWIGAVNNIIGLFAALGTYRDNEKLKTQAVFKNFILILEKNDKLLNLSSFYELGNKIDVRKINLGNKRRQIIYDAVFSILENQNLDIITWDFFLNK